MARQLPNDRLPDICSGTARNKDCHHTSPSNVASCSSAIGTHNSVELPAPSEGAEDGHSPKRRPTSEMQSDASSSGSVHDNHASHFAGAHHFVSYGGTYNNILGNYTVLTEGQNPDSAPPSNLSGIIPDLPVLRREEVSPKHQIYKGSGYRFYTAQSSGRVVALKVYEGNRAKERCSQAAGFYAAVMHPNIPLLFAVSPLASKDSFLVFDGEYEGTVDYILGKALEKDLRQGLILGLQTVIGLSSGLDYLQDQKYPFTLIGLEHFILLSSKQGVVISFDPEALGPMAEPAEQRSDNETDDATHVLPIFNELCQKTFDAARKDHYQNQIRRASIDDDKGYISDDDISEDELRTGDTRQRISDTEPGDPGPSTKSTQGQRRKGRRQQLIWRSFTDETITLNQISRDFQYFLNTHASSLEPALIRRRGRYTARTPHRCPGYNRIEITLTPNITRSAIVFHSSPTPYEICPVCREVVKDAEIFNCICGEEDDESIPTVRCSRCSEWHHRPCVHFYDHDFQNFVCEHCKKSDVVCKSEPSNSTAGAASPAASLPHRSAPTERTASTTTVAEFRKKYQDFLPSQMSSVPRRDRGAVLTGNLEVSTPPSPPDRTARTARIMTNAELIKKYQDFLPPQPPTASRQVAKATVTRTSEVPSAPPTTAKNLEQRYSEEDQKSENSVIRAKRFSWARPRAIAQR